jgi:beta-galactosidase
MGVSLQDFAQAEDDSEAWSPLHPQVKSELKMSMPWPQVTAFRLDMDFDQDWRFFREPVAKPDANPRPSYIPPASALVKTGTFPLSTKNQDVMTGERTARYVCLEAFSSYNVTPFASVAEFYLLDAGGQPLSRTDWKVAYTDSEDIGAGDLAINAIDGDPKTKWHSEWSGAQPPFPHMLVFDLGKPTKFSGFRYLARYDGNPSGMIKDWKFFAFNQAPPVSKRTVKPVLDSVKLNDAKWEKVNLPHSVRLEPLNASGGRNFQGVCWYKKHFILNNAWKGRKLFLHFDGAMQVADIWLNGKLLMTHYGGYLPFTVDISAARFNAENVLSVRLDNSDNPEVPPGKPQNALDFTYFGGLYRSVRLLALDPLHITDPILANKVAGGGIFVTTPRVSAASAAVNIKTDIINESATERNCKITQELFGPNGEVVATGFAESKIDARASYATSQTLDVLSPKLWHPYHPYLYVLHTVVKEGDRPVDDTYTRIGIRSIRFDKDTGMYINGERFFSLGANRHQDHPYVGYALPHSAQYRDVKKLRDAGFTSYRSHYTMDPSWMDACDELGMLAIVSNPGWQFVGNDLFKQRVYQDAREMVRRDRNHPSVILWEAQLNESDNDDIAPTLYNAVHEEYPDAPCYTAGDRVTTIPGNVSWDLDYARNDGSKPFWIREWGDQVDNWTDQQSSSRIPRGWGETPMLVQAWSHLSRMDGIWGMNDGPQGKDKGSLSGAGLWAGIDCYRGYHHQPFYGGPLDLFRLPKFDYYMFQSQRPVDIHVPGVDGGPMVFIANFAAFISPSAVTVFSNCEEVRLYRNNKLVAQQKPDEGHRIPHPPFTFNVGQVSQEHSMLFSTGVAAPGVEVGELKAEGLIGGKVAASHVVISPGVPTHITLEADICGRALVADGSDWVRVYARLCDSRGTTYPMGDDMVTFTVEGEGSVIGDASIGANPTRAEAGIATALIRSTKRPGAIVVQANAFGLKMGEIKIESVKGSGGYVINAEVKK